MTGKTELLGDLQTGRGIRNGRLRPSQDRHIRAFGDLPCGGLVAERFQNLRWRPYEQDAGLIARARQLGLLRQKTVSRMDRVHIVLFGDPQNPLNVQIGSDRLARLPHCVGFVSLETM